MVDHADGVLVAFLGAFAAEPPVETRRGGRSGAWGVADGEVSEVGGDAWGWVTRGWEGGEDAGVHRLADLWGVGGWVWIVGVGLGERMTGWEI